MLNLFPRFYQIEVTFFTFSVAKYKLLSLWRWHILIDSLLSNTIAAFCFISAGFGAQA